jgi:hypothetical protein
MSVRTALKQGIARTLYALVRNVAPITYAQDGLSNKRGLNDCSTSAPPDRPLTRSYPRPLAVRRACTVSGRSRLDPSPPSQAPARQKQC